MWLAIFLSILYLQSVLANDQFSFQKTDPNTIKITWNHIDIDEKFKQHQIIKFARINKCYALRILNDILWDPVLCAKPFKPDGNPLKPAVFAGKIANSLSTGTRPFVQHIGNAKGIKIVMKRPDILPQPEVEPQGNNVEAHRPNFLADVRKKSCDTRAVCDIVCRPLRCQNEYIKSNPQIGMPGNRKESPVKRIIVHCEEELACIGQIKINGGDDTTFPALQHRQLFADIHCGDHYQSCHGGAYMFKDVHTAMVYQNIRESNVIFKHLVVAGVSVVPHDEGRHLGKGPMDQGFKFYMNSIYTQDVYRFILDAWAPYSAVGCVFQLGGLIADHNAYTGKGFSQIFTKKTSAVEIACTGKGSCSGSIVFLRRCGGDVNVNCVENACSLLTIIIKKHEDCKGLTNLRQITINTEEPPKANVRILVLCEGGPKTPSQNCIHVTGSKHKKKTTNDFDEKNRQSSLGIFEFYDGAVYKAYLTAILKQLQHDFEDESKKGVVENNLQWILQDAQLDYLGGVMLEACIGTLTVGVIFAGGTIGATALAFEAGLVTGMAVGSAVASTIFPVVLPLAIPLFIFIGLQYKKDKKKKKRQTDYAIDEKYIFSNAHKEAYNEYNENGFEYGKYYNQLQQSSMSNVDSDDSVEAMDDMISQAMQYDFDNIMDYSDLSEPLQYGLHQNVYSDDPGQLMSIEGYNDSLLLMMSGVSIMMIMCSICCLLFCCGIVFVTVCFVNKCDDACALDDGDDIQVFSLRKVILNIFHSSDSESNAIDDDNEQIICGNNEN